MFEEKHLFANPEVHEGSTALIKSQNKEAKGPAK